MVQTRSGRDTAASTTPQGSRHAVEVQQHTGSSIQMAEATNQLRSVPVQQGNVENSPSMITRIMSQLGLQSGAENPSIEQEQQLDLVLNEIQPTLRIMQHPTLVNINLPNQLKQALIQCRSINEVTSAVYWFKWNQQTPHLQCVKKALQVAIEWGNDKQVDQSEHMICRQQLACCELLLAEQSQYDKYTSLAMEQSPDKSSSIEAVTQNAPCFGHKASGGFLTTSISRPAPRHFTSARNRSPMSRSRGAQLGAQAIQNPFSQYNNSTYLQPAFPSYPPPPLAPPFLQQQPELPHVPTLHSWPQVQVPQVTAAPCFNNSFSSGLYTSMPPNLAVDGLSAAASKTQVDLKIGKLQAFTGEQNVVGFLSTFEGWAEIKHLEGKAKLIALVAHLNGEALDVIQNEGPFEDYQQAKQCLLTNFEQQAKKYYYELLQIKRGSKSISEYNAAYSKLRNKAKPYLNALTEIEHFINGLEPEPLKQKLAINDPSSLRAAMELAQKLDSMFQASKQQAVKGANLGFGSNQRTQCKSCMKWHNVADKHVCFTIPSDSKASGNSRQWSGQKNYRNNAVEMSEMPQDVAPDVKAIVEDNQPPTAAPAEHAEQSDDDYPGMGFY